MILNIDIDTSRNSLSVKLDGMKQEDYSALASEVLDRAKVFIIHLPEHTPADDPKRDEFWNVIATGKGWTTHSSDLLQHDSLAEKGDEATLGADSSNDID